MEYEAETAENKIFTETTGMEYDEGILCDVHSSGVVRINAIAASFEQFYELKRENLYTWT